CLERVTTEECLGRGVGFEPADVADLHRAGRLTFVTGPVPVRVEPAGEEHRALHPLSGRTRVGGGAARDLPCADQTAAHRELAVRVVHGRLRTGDLDRRRWNGGCGCGEREPGHDGCERYRLRRADHSLLLSVVGASSYRGTPPRNGHAE